MCIYNIHSANVYTYVNFLTLHKFSYIQAAKVAIVSAAGAGRSSMVAKALAGNFGQYDCPAGMVDAAEETLWFTDKVMRIYIYIYIIYICMYIYIYK